MGGVIITSALIALALTFGFWYLLHVIASQRTIEEMKDDFTNNMTHELKTPIAIAYAANDSLLQFPDPQDEERTKKISDSSPRPTLETIGSGREYSRHEYGTT